MRALNYRDLLEKLKEAQRQLFDLKIQLANQQLKNYMQIAKVRKEIARLQTVMTEKRAKGEENTEAKVEAKQELPKKVKGKKTAQKKESKKKKKRPFLGKEKVKAK